MDETASQPVYCMTELGASQLNTAKPALNPAPKPAPKPEPKPEPKLAPEQPTENATEKPTETPVKGETFEEMVQKYESAAIEEPSIAQITHRNARRRSIDFRRQINHGINGATCIWGLKYIKEKISEAPPLDTDEPDDLDPMVKWRLRALNFMCRDWHPQRKETRILQGVMAAYRSGKLKARGRQGDCLVQWGPETALTS